MTTSAPQWPGQEGQQEEREAEITAARPRLLPAQPTPVPPPRLLPAQPTPAPPQPTSGPPQPTSSPAQPELEPERLASAGMRRTGGVTPTPGERRELGTPGSGVEGRPTLRAVPDERPTALRQAQTSNPARPGRRATGRRNRFGVVRDPAERDLWAARRRARGNLPPPAAVTRDIALALLEVEAGCRSAAQLERVFSPELWQALEHRIGRRGGPLPSGRSLISVRWQEDAPGLADTVAVVQKGDVVRPVALRLDASGGRWRVTELRWWRNETDTATTPGRDDGGSS